VVQEFLSRQVTRVCRGLVAPDDHPDLVFQKQLLIAGSLVIIPIGLIWGAMYLLYGETLASLIPSGYSLASLASLVFCNRFRKFHIFRFVQLALILVCPFVLMLSLGGFSSGSTVIIWSVLAPFGAMLFYRRRIAHRWLAAYLALIVASGLLQPLLSEVNNLPRPLVVSLYVLNIGVVSAITFALMFYFIRGKNTALDLLRLEQEKSERLLLNVLPKEIAPALKAGRQTIAEHYDVASVMFADIVGFTDLSVRLSPAEMVRLLNEIFSHFDRLVETYGLEKIRTIGDNYMVAAGVPVPLERHAHRMAAMALDLCDFVQFLPPYQGYKINFRVGINTGPVVAGVIGQQKFHYDLWGDTVNTASRMESSGVPGKIQITTATRDCIQDEFVCLLRGVVPIKGKGPMETWFLAGRKTPAAAGQVSA